MSLAAENASLRAALEPLKALLQPGLAPGELVGVYLRGDALNAIHAALSTPPSAAVERVRLMGAVVDAAKTMVDYLPGEYLEQDFPPPAHEGSCHPDAGCDGTCADRYNMAMYSGVRRNLTAALTALEANGTHDAAPLHERIEALAGEWEAAVDDRTRDIERRYAYEDCARQLRSALKGEG